MIRFRGDIEGLRAIAVLLVILDHLKVPGFHGGFIGVDVFFVISGYLITSLLAAEYAAKAAERDGFGSISITHFYLRRARRILPAALAVIGAVVIASHQLLNALRVEQVQHDALWATFFGSNINFIRQANDYFAEGFATSSPFRHYWSLAVEEQFYFVWPVLFLGITALLHGVRIGRLRVNWRLRLGIVLAVIGSASLAWSIVESSNNPASAYFSTFTRTWELAVGALIAIATLHTTAVDFRRATAASVAGVGLLVAASIFIDGTSTFPGYLALLPTLGAGLLIIAGISQRLPVPNQVLTLAPMRFVGKISYSLYLWHWPLIVFAAALYPQASTEPLTRAALFVAMLAISTASYYAIERPFRKMRFTREDAKSGRRKGFRKDRDLRKLREAVGMLAAAGILVATFAVALSYQRARAETGDISVATSTPVVTEKPSTAPIVPVVSTPYDKLLARWSVKVKQGLALQSLPSNLQPIQDHLKQVVAPCQTYRLDIVDHLDECAWGNPNAPNVVAITGDSHAGMWLTTLQGALDPNLWRLYPFTRSWCGWSGGSEAVGSDVAAKNEDCSALQAQTLQQMKKLNVDVVVLSEDWIRPREKMAAALSGYAALDARVVVLGHTPLVVPDFLSCLKGSADIASCNGALTSKELRDLDLERSAASQFEIPFIDTTPWFCVELGCPSVIDRAPVFADGGHISTEIVPKFVPLLRQSLLNAGAIAADGSAAEAG